MMMMMMMMVKKKKKNKMVMSMARKSLRYDDCYGREGLHVDAFQIHLYRSRSCD